MIKDEIRSILKTLLEKSETKQISWLPFEGAPPEMEDYVVSFPRSSVNLFKNGEGAIVANILNSSGTVVGSISSNEGSISDNKLLKELFDCVRQSVLKAEETLEDIRQALASKEILAGSKNAAGITEDDIPF